MAEGMVGLQGLQRRAGAAAPLAGRNPAGYRTHASGCGSAAVNNITPLKRRAFKAAVAGVHLWPPLRHPPPCCTHPPLPVQLRQRHLLVNKSAAREQAHQVS